MHSDFHKVDESVITIAGIIRSTRTVPTGCQRPVHSHCCWGGETCDSDFLLVWTPGHLLFCDNYQVGFRYLGVRPA
jgi:hypothetical protein